MKILYDREIETDVATERQLLNFANKARRAGNANIIDALLPSIQGEQNECLIANALNFSSNIYDYGGEPRYFPDGSYRWVMELPINMPIVKREAIAKTLGCKLEGRLIFLPKHIGNAARAFDQGLAFQEFIKNNGEI